MKPNQFSIIILFISTLAACAPSGGTSKNNSNESASAKFVCTDIVGSITSAELAVIHLGQTTAITIETSSNSLTYSSPSQTCTVISAGTVADITNRLDSGTLCVDTDILPTTNIEALSVQTTTGGSSSNGLSEDQVRLKNSTYSEFREDLSDLIDELEAFGGLTLSTSAGTISCTGVGSSGL